ncbi:MAG: flagellar hook-associated protein FlgK [Deltaproteobacteria bacterium]|nr:flagellar hook-associated protein FlgK [Deltaproteobacteria bacterium]
MGINGVNSLLDISGRSLGVQSQAIRVIGNNIANVNTPGYSRRRVDIASLEPATEADAAFGNGATVQQVTRIVDSFINGQLRDKMNERSRAEVRDEFFARAENLFGVAGALPTIGGELSDFFSALDDLAANPSDISLRSAVIDAGRQLTLTIRSASEEISGLQRQADNRLGAVVENLNTISSKLADVNIKIRGTEANGQENLALRDQRDELLRQMSEITTVQTVENSDGSVYVTLPSGFALVTSTASNALELDGSPSFQPVGGYPAGLDGGPLNFIVYDYDPSAGESQINLTDALAAGGGELGGLLSLRGIQAATDTSMFDTDGDLVQLGARIEAIARDLLTRFNQSFVGPDENGGNPNHQASSFDLIDISSGVYTPTAAFGLFSFAGAADTGGTLGLADNTDLTNSGLENFSSVLEWGVATPEEFAAGRDLNPALLGVIVTASGDATNITTSTGYLGLRALREQTVNYNVGVFTGTTTLERLYNDTVTYVGSLRNTAVAEYESARAQETQVQEYQNSISGVSLDEEFAKLILFQKAFEGSARMIRVGDELLDEIIGILS